MFFVFLPQSPLKIKIIPVILEVPYHTILHQLLVEQSLS